MEQPNIDICEKLKDPLIHEAVQNTLNDDTIFTGIKSKSNTNDDNHNGSLSADNQTIAVLSKNERKRLLKIQRWEVQKRFKKESQKEKKRLKHQPNHELQSIDNNSVIYQNQSIQQTLSPTPSFSSSQQLQQIFTNPNDEINKNNNVKSTSITKQQLKKQNFLNQCSNSFSIIIDCAFDDFHSDKDLKSLGQQIGYCYGANHKHSNPCNIYLTDMGIKLTNQLKKSKCECWTGVHLSNKCYTDMQDIFIINHSNSSSLRCSGSHEPASNSSSSSNSNSSSSHNNNNNNSDGNNSSISSSSRSSSSNNNHHSSSNTLHMKAGNDSLPSPTDTSSTTDTQHTISSVHLPLHQPFTTHSEPSQEEQQSPQNRQSHTPSTSSLPLTIKKPKELVYLTSDAEDVLESLDSHCAYIIGGIVDRNRLKGMTYEKAKKQGIRTAKLPIKEYFKLSATHVLTINHVFEILLTFNVLKDWKATLECILPARKEIKSLDSLLAAESVTEEGVAVTLE